MLIQGSALLLGASFIVAIGQGQSPTVTYIALAGFCLCRGVYDATIYATLFDVIEARATGQRRLA